MASRGCTAILIQKLGPGSVVVYHEALSMFIYFKQNGFDPRSNRGRGVWARSSAWLERLTFIGNQVSNPLENRVFQSNEAAARSK